MYPFHLHTAPPLFAILLLLLAGACPSRVLAVEANATVSGRAEVIDGDTLDIDSSRIQLFGIDAPENTQHCATARGGQWACGQAAHRALEQMMAGRPVTCRGQGLDDYGRLLAVYTTPRGELNEAMVRQGLA